MKLNNAQRHRHISLARSYADAMERLHLDDCVRTERDLLDHLQSLVADAYLAGFDAGTVTINTCAVQGCARNASRDGYYCEHHRAKP